jgi:hypothetical protein
MSKLQIHHRNRRLQENMTRAAEAYMVAFSSPFGLGCQSPLQLKQSLSKPALQRPHVQAAEPYRPAAGNIQLSATFSLPGTSARAQAGAMVRVKSRRVAVVARRMLKVSFTKATQAVFHPARAAGAAYTHPAAALASLVFDLLDVTLSSFPPGHAHAVIALMCHLIMDLLLASPY